jgi:hypothetical protein
MSTQIDPRVRARLKKIGVDAVRSKLFYHMNVSTLAGPGQPEDLGDGLRSVVRTCKYGSTKRPRRKLGRTGL